MEQLVGSVPNGAIYVTTATHYTSAARQPRASVLVSDCAMILTMIFPQKTFRAKLIVLALLGWVPVVAGNQTVQPPAQVLAKEYVSPDHRFKIRFPDVPKEFDLQADTKTGAIVSHQVMLNSDITYWLNFTDYPINLEQGNAVKAILDRARDDGLARVAKEDPHIVAESDMSVDGYPGRFVRVELKGDAILRFKIVLSANRLYVLCVGTPKGDPKNVEAQKGYDRVATNFFDSFKIIPPLEADLSATWTECSSAQGKYRVEFPGTPFRWSFPLESLRTPSTMYVTAYNSSGQYSVMYFDYAETPMPTDPAALKKFLDDLRDGQMDRSEQMGGKLTVVSETDITFDGHPGRFMVAEVNGVGVYRVKTVIVKNRVYLITVITVRDDPKVSDTKDHEKLSMKFIDSFCLLKNDGHAEF